MTHTVVTSFSPAGYEEYGRRFIETFRKFWPASVKLVVVHEWPDGHWPELGEIEGAAEWVHFDHVTGLRRYLNAVETFPLTSGIVGPNQYSIQQDARQARKCFIEAWAVEHYGGKVVWIDADVITHAPVPDGFIDEVLPDDKLCCYLGRERVYTESGFLGYNANHPMCLAFLRLYRGLFETGAFLTFPAWHDCVAFDAARISVSEQVPDAFVNLGAGVDPGPGLNVFVNSRLGAYMDHLKGQRKGSVRSPDSDLTVKRDEPHWLAKAG